MGATLYSPNCREGSFSEIGGSKPLDQHTTYSEQSRVTLGSCCLLPGHSHTCCEDLLRGATGCCSRVARELLLCSALRTARSIGYNRTFFTGSRVALSVPSRQLSA